MSRRRPRLRVELAVEYLPDEAFRQSLEVFVECLVVCSSGHVAVAGDGHSRGGLHDNVLDNFPRSRIAAAQLRIGHRIRRRDRETRCDGGERFMATSDSVKEELRANYAKASRAGRRAARTEPRAAAATYLRDREALRIELTNGASLTVPAALIPGLEHAPHRDRLSVEVLGRGGGLHWEALDLDLSVPALVASLRLWSTTRNARHSRSPP